VAFSLGSIKATLDLDASNFTQALGKAQGSLGPFRANLGKIAGAAAGVLSVATAFKLLGDGISEAAQAEQAITKLTAALEAQGNSASGAKALAQDVVEFAGAFERLTGIDDAKLVDVAARLNNLGVAGASLPAATQAVANLSAAMGVDMETAAQQLALTLEGTAGRIARVVPEVGRLTEEQLRNGEAFDIVAKKFEGAAAKLGGTFTGNLERAKQGFDDLKKAVGEGFIAAMTPALESLNTFLTRLGETPQFMEMLRNVGTQVANGIVTGFQLAAQAVAGFLFAWQSGVQLVQQGAAVWYQLKATILGTIFESAQALGQFAEQLALTVQNVPVIGEKLAEGLRGASAAAHELVGGLAQSAAEAQKNADAAIQAAAAQQKNVDAAKQFALAVTSSRGPVEAVKGALKGAADAAGLAAGNSVKLATGIKGAVESANKLPPYAQAAADAIAAAEQRAAGLRGELEGAASAASAAAAASDGIATGGGGGGGIGGGDAFGRRSGGSHSLNLSNPFAAQAELEAAEADLRRISNGAKNAYVGTAALNNQRAFVERLRAAVAAQTEAANAEFMQQLLSELNAQGTIDPAQRSRIIAERMAEATRLGIIPRAGTGGGGQFSGSACRIGPGPGTVGSSGGTVTTIA
jgi:hypothetical protein